MQFNHNTNGDIMGRLENNYYKNQFRLTKRHVCIRNKYKH